MSDPTPDSFEARYYQAVKNSEGLAAQLRARDLAAADAAAAAKAGPPPVDHLATAQKSAAEAMLDPAYVEQCRQWAWLRNAPIWVTKARPGWPEGTSLESFIRAEYGLAPDGESLVAPPEQPEAPPEPVAKTHMGDLLAKMGRRS